MAEDKVRLVHMTEGEGWGGIETHLHFLLKGLVKSGLFEVECITFHRGLLAERLEKSGVGVRVFERVTKFDPTLFIRLVRHLKVSRVRIIHLHGYLAIIYGIPAAIIARIPFRVATLHASPDQTSLKKETSRLSIYLAIAYALIIKSRCYLIAVSYDVFKSHVARRKITSHRMRVVHNGVSVGEIRSRTSSISRRSLNIPDVSCVVGIVGRIDGNKGHIYLLNAARTILSQRQDVHFAIVGSGPLEEDLKEFCKTHCLENYVHFYGFQKNILDFISLFDVMVISSLHEGIPYNLLEAMACGVTVVSSNVGGIPEVIQTDVNGLLVPAKASKEMAECILRLLETPTLRDKLSRAALDTVQRSFSQDVMVKSTIDFYQTIMN
jgi:L-malate glycosyltransferase